MAIQKWPEPCRASSTVFNCLSGLAARCYNYSPAISITQGYEYLIPPMWVALDAFHGFLLEFKDTARMCFRNVYPGGVTPDLRPTVGGPQHF